MGRFRFAVPSLLLLTCCGASDTPESVNCGTSGHDGDAHSDHGAYIALLCPFVVLGIAVGSHRIQRHFKFLSFIPFTVLLLLEGIVVGLVSDVSTKDMEVARMNDFSRSVEMWRAIDPHLLLYGFLPALVFGDAMNINIQKLKTMLAQVLLLATFGVGIGAFLTAIVARYVLPYDWDWNTAMVFGAICSATDPVAVVAVLKQLGCSAKLTMLIEGESLFNDGTAMVLFLLFNNLIEGVEYTSGAIVSFFFRNVLGAVALGLVLGFLGISCGIRLPDTATDHLAATVQVTMTIALAYLSFYASEKWGMSGVLGCVSAAFVVSKYGWLLIKERQTVEHVWHTLEFCGNAIIFLLAGLIISETLFDQLVSDDDTAHVVGAQDFGYGILVFVLALFIRYAMLVVLFPVLSRSGYGLAWREVIVVGWGGLRGAVGLALAIFFENNKEVDEETSIRLLFIVCVFVTCTLLINAVTAPWIVRSLGLCKESTTKVILDEAVLKRFHRHAMETLSSTIMHKSREAGAISWYDTVGFNREAVQLGLKHVTGPEAVFPEMLFQEANRLSNEIAAAAYASEAATAAADDENDDFHRYSAKTVGGVVQVWAYKTKDKAVFPHGPANPGDYIVVRTEQVPNTGGCFDVYGVGKDYFEKTYAEVPGRETTFRKMGHIWAQKMVEDFEVPARPTGDEQRDQVLKGKKGDYLIKPAGEGDLMYTISREKFHELYELDRVQHWRALRRAGSRKVVERRNSERGICTAAEIEGAVKRFSTRKARKEGIDAAGAGAVPGGTDKALLLGRYFYYAD